MVVRFPISPFPLIGKVVRTARSSPVRAVFWRGEANAGRRGPICNPVFAESGSRMGSHDRAAGSSAPTASDTSTPGPVTPARASLSARKRRRYKRRLPDPTMTRSNALYCFCPNRSSTSHPDTIFNSRFDRALCREPSAIQKHLDARSYPHGP